MRAGWAGGVHLHQDDRREESAVVGGCTVLDGSRGLLDSEGDCVMMEFLISKKAAIEALGERPSNWCDTPEEIQAVADWDTYSEAIRNIKTVDAVYVVRCGECKYKKETGYCPNVEMFVGDNFYCAFGKRESNGG